MSEILAKTWNRSESGLLWECYWFTRGGGFFKRPMASGIFVGPHKFPSEEAFWAAYDEEAEKFNGHRPPAQALSEKEGSE